MSSATSDFITARCLWVAATKVVLLPSGFTIRFAPAINGTVGRYVSGRVMA